jgi:hypothetical protein
MTKIRKSAIINEYLFGFRYNFGPSSIAEVEGQLFLAWTEPDRSPHIFISQFEGRRWTVPEILYEAPSSDVQVYDPSLQCINGELHLFFAVGRVAESRVKGARGYAMASFDHGHTWTEPILLPYNSPSPGKGVHKPNGDLYFACQDGHCIEFVTRSGSGIWYLSAVLRSSKHNPSMPILVQHNDGVIQVLTRSDCGRVLTAFLQPNESEWGKLYPTEIPTPNSPIDAISLQDGRFVLAYNHSESVRTPICLATSGDGVEWNLGILIDDGEDQLTFPCLHQDRNGYLHIIYARRKMRQIVHCVIDSRKI